MVQLMEHLTEAASKDPALAGNLPNHLAAGTIAAMLVGAFKPTFPLSSEDVLATIRPENPDEDYRVLEIVAGMLAAGVAKADHTMAQAAALRDQIANLDPELMARSEAAASEMAKQPQ